jgi:hypothetical protein
MAYPLQLVPEDRSYFSLDDVILYGECPAKLPEVTNNFVTCQEQIWSSLVSDCFTWITGKSLTGVFPSRKTFDSQFNIFWDKLRPRITTALSTDLLLVSRDRCSKVYNFFSSLKSFEIICHDQIFEYQSNKFVLGVPLTVMRHSNVVYSFYLDKLSSPNKLHKMYSVASSVIHNVTKDLLSGFTYIKKPCIVRAQNFSFHTLPPVRDLSNVVDNIVIGMKHVKYPVLSSHCQMCNKKSVCSWFNE